MEKTKTPTKQKKISLSEIKKELVQLTDIAQAVNARCFYLREEVKLLEPKNKN